MSDPLIDRIEKRLEGYVGLPLEPVIVRSMYAELLEELEDEIERLENDF